MRMEHPVVALSCDAAGTRLLTVLEPVALTLDRPPGAPPGPGITIAVWDVASRKRLYTLPAPEPGHQFRRLFSPDGTRLVTQMTRRPGRPVGDGPPPLVVRDGATGETLYEVAGSETAVGFVSKDNE